MWSLRKIQVSDVDFLLAQQIRTAVFVQEQGVDASDEYDAFEEVSQHYLVTADSKAVATARWRFTPNGIKLERFAVLPNHRGKGIGQYLLKKMIEEVQKYAKPIYLHAQIQVADFYQKLGFEKEGALFEEAGIQHFKMLFKQ
ncbi:MAG: GNAT family N-acetyltransferase [Flavobacteriales bacterium]|nr:GNAT family N-acetyltransferase [Flavobacteriales bacterium]